MKSVRRWLAMAAFAAVILQAGSAWAAPTPQSLNAVSFSDATHGYIAGGYTSNDGVLAYTSNGGVTWKPMQRAGFWSRSIAASTDGSSATASSDWVDTVISTSNSGDTWTAEAPVFGAPGPHIYDVAYLSGGRVAVGQQLTAQNGYVGVISKASGASWTPYLKGPVYPPPNEEDPAPFTYAYLTSVDGAAGGQNALAVGTEFTDSTYATVKRALIYRTTNGGSDWTTDTPAAALLNDVTAVTMADTSVAFATTQITGKGPGTRTLLRRTGANAWTALNSTLPLGFQANALDAYDADHLVVVGNGGKVAYTTNASAPAPSWTSLSAGTNDLYGVQMLGPDDWIVVGGNETLVRFVNGAVVPGGSTSVAAPTVSIASPAPGFTLPAPSTITGTASDSGIGVLKVEVLIKRDNNTYWNGSSWVADANQWRAASGTTAWSYPFSPGAPAPTSLTIYARATDGMNQVNQTSVVSSGGTVDTTPPNTTSDAKPNYAAGGGQVITLTPNDAGSGVASTEWRINGGSFTAGRSVQVPSPAGTYTLEFHSTDGAGNVETLKSATFTVTGSSGETFLPVYRFFNKTNGSHFYTASEAEKNSVLANLSAIYALDGPAYKVSSAFTTPLYRFYNKGNGSHFYTASEAEKNSVVANLSATYALDGPAYKVSSAAGPGTVPVYRFFNKKNGSHFYTASEAEKNSVLANLSATYALDGTAFYVAP